MQGNVPSINGHIDFPTAIDRLQFSARCALGRSAGNGSGDFYDVLQLSAGRWGIAVADVAADPVDDPQRTAGGITVARAVLRATAQIQRRPSLVLAALNRALLAWPAPERRTMTAVFAIVRPTRAGAWVRICVAGPQTAFLRRADGAVSVLAKPGTPLGQRTDPCLHDARLLMRPGDCLVLVTDSLTSALAAGGQTLSGAIPLPLLLAGLDCTSAARCADVIIRAAVHAHGRRPDTEIVVLVLKVPTRRRGAGTHAAGWPGTQRSATALPLSPTQSGQP